MEDSLLCPSHKCNIMDLLPILMDTDVEEGITLLPSQLNRELQMSTEERLTKLCKPTRRYRVYTEVNTFSRTPDIVIFQNFEPGSVYKTTLSFLNLHPVSRHFRVVTGNSPYFEISGPTEDCSAKLAPGMSYTLNILFFPTDNRNYIHHITIMTDAESFKVPVYGLGAQALLNLPDEIKLASTAINICSEKTLVLHNFGKATASFTICVKDPFFVTPHKNLLPAGEFMELNVTCKSPLLGNIKESIIFTYNDITLTIPVECEVYNININLDKDNIVFDDIYMGLKRQDSVTVYNPSNHYIKFKWKLHKSLAIDQFENSKLIKNLESVKELEKKRCNKLEKMNIIDYEGHSKICDKIFNNEVTELQIHDLYPYKNPAFEIVPLNGEILPNNSKTFIISFAPLKTEHYESWAYLDVTGRSNRLPLKLSGKGQGPYISLNVKVLNIGDVFLCATHHYEVAVKNEGNIPATVVFNECETDFNSTIKCVPKKLRLLHQDCVSAFIVSFYSESKGEFIETVEFIIKESGEKVHFVLKGNVVCPMLKTDIKGLDFGVFPFGIKQEKEFVLINDCQVPIDFKIVLKECTIPNEIVFEPYQGIVEAYAKKSVSVQLNSGRSKKVDTNFKIIMWGAEQYSLNTFLKYTCICPKIICTPSYVKIKFCFLNFDYKRTIRLKNEDAVAGVVIYTPKTEDTSITCSLSQTEFEILPYESEDIELSIKTNALGISNFPLIFTVAGSEPRDLCTVTVDGQGPVVSYRPEEVQFGEILLLQDVATDLTLVNDSPIPAFVTITKGNNSFFEIDTTEVEIMPDEERNIEISVYLTDTGRYSSTVNVSIENGESIDIKVSGEGIGYSLLCEPELEAAWCCTRTLLTHQLFSLPIKMTNMGQKHYRIRWTANPNIKSIKDGAGENEPGYCFRIRPEYFELPFRQSQIFEIQGQSKDQRYVEEEFYLFALIDRSSKLSLVTSIKVTANFVEPSVSITRPALDVLVANSENHHFLHLEDSLSIENPLSCEMGLNLYTTNEYYLITDENRRSFTTQTIEGHGQLNMKIQFAPNVLEKRYFKRTGQLTVGYANHPNSVQMELKTEVCFPTVSLTPAIVDFGCIPINSYSYKRVILQNLTFLPAKYSWEILEEFFEIERLPPAKEQIEEEDKVYKQLEQNVEKNEQEIIGGTPPEKLLDLEPEEKTNKVEDKEKRKQKKETKKNDYDRPIRTKDYYENEIRKVLLPTIERFMDDTVEPFLFQDKLTCLNYDEYDISTILTIQPFKGELQPYEYGVITVGFLPPPNTRIRVKASCQVEGGERELLSISGISSKISYELDKKDVEFGSKLFCEVCEYSIILSNTGFCKFKYTINCNEDSASLEPGMLNISPKSGTLQPDQKISLKIKYFPGLVGEFHESFSMRIEYLEPFEVKIHGYGVFSQIFAHVPRPLIAELPSELLYEAVSSVSLHYLQSLHEGRNCLTNNNGVLEKSDLQPDMFPGLSDEWSVITSNNVYPSIMDIDLSLERMLLSQHIARNPGLLAQHTVSKRVKVIPEFKTPPYLLDFGCVIIEKPVCYTVLLVNYGPVVTEIKLVKESNVLEKNKIKIEFVPKKLNVGESIPLYVVFHPTLKRYPDLDVSIKESFSLLVTHGATIPVLISATVTLPRLIFEHTSIDFGEVNVGCCLRKSVLIKNTGYVLSKWTAECKKKYTYFIKPTKGELPPGTKDMIDIYFMPTSKEFIPGRIVVYVEGSPNTTSINLTGIGIGVNLVFNETDLKFKSSLPYSQKSNMILIVQNVSPSPVEFCFADFDEGYKQDKLWINTYLNSFHVKRALVPQRQAGEPINSVFEENYMMYLNELRKTLLKTEEVNNDTSETETEATEEPEDPLINYSPQEIARMINEYIESKCVVEDSGSTDIHDPDEMFYSSMKVVEPKTSKIMEVQKLQSGIFIIFHGSRCTDYLKAANQTGIKLNIPVYSINRLIYEALLEGNADCSADILALINKEFQFVATEEDLIPVPYEDEYDVLERKVYAILHNKKPQVKKTAKEKKTDKSAKTSEKGSVKQRGKKDKDSNTLADIPVDMFEELLKYKFKSFSDGLVIESLYSDFLSKFNITLNTILRAVGNSKYVQIILLSYTLQNYVNNEVQKRQIKEAVVSKEKLETAQKGKSGKQKSSASTKSSKKKEKPANLEKNILKNLPKEEKAEFDAFHELLSDAVEICRFWEKSGLGLKEIKSSMKPDDEVKDSIKELKSVQNKKYRSINDEPTSENGVLLWVINDANRNKSIDFAEVICSSLKESSDLEEAKNDLAVKLVEEKIESTVLFTTVSRYGDTKTGVSNVFDITNYEQEKKESVTSNINLVAKNAKKKTTKATKAPDVVRAEFTPRRTLKSEEVVYYLFTFNPKKPGMYEHSFSVHVTGLNMNYYINCSALCELPAINFDPYVLFPKVLDSYRDKALTTNFVYIKEMNVFDFGLTFVDSEKPHTYECKLLLQNMSQIQANVKASVDDKILYSLPTTKLTLEPKQEVQLPISVKPTKLGLLQTWLCISVTNNPIPKKVKIVTKSCKFDFRIKPKVLYFDKVPVKSFLQKKINLSNHSPISLKWKFIDSSWAQQIYKISSVEGVLGPFSVFDITFKYTPDKEESLPKKQLPIHVFDPHFSNKVPFYVDNISLHADAIEYKLEYSDHIDLGEVKARLTHEIPFTILNKGFLNICVTFNKIDNPLNDTKNVRKFFRLNNTNEILSPNKLFTGILFFTPTKQVQFTEEPIFVCNIVECTNADSIMDSFVIKVSGKVYFSNFELNPSADVTFGHQQIHSLKKQTLEIKNTGRFPFTYELISLNPAEGPLLKPVNKKNKKGKGETNKSKSDKGSKKSGGKKNKDDKKKPPPPPKTSLYVGCFSISSPDGEIMPNEIAHINIESTPEESREYQEIVYLNVSEPRDEDLKGKEINLSVIGCEPLLNFDYRKIFREQYITDKLENLHLPNNVGNHNIYESSEQTLHFKKVPLNTKAVCRIYMQNIGHVVAHVTAKIDCSSKTIFKASPCTKHILPFSTKPLSIIFSPENVGESIAKLELSYNSSVNNKFSIALVGEALIPKVKVIEPEVKENNIGIINFQHTFIGDVKIQRIKIQNVGGIPARAILEIRNNVKEMLMLKACEDTYGMLNVSDLEEFQNTKYSTLINLSTDQIANFDLIYEPYVEDTFTAYIRIQTVNNPFETVQITVNADSYYHDIYLDGLTPYKMKNNVMGYKIDFGFSYLSYLQIINFSIKNNSDEFTYKFDFAPNLSSLTFTPRVGHLQPFTKKEIVATYYSKKPQYFEKETVECNINKIEYIYDDYEDLSWDDRQKISTCDYPEIGDEKAKHARMSCEEEAENPNNARETNAKIKEAIDDKPEPKYQIIPGSSEVISCIISVTADYASYINDVNEIAFGETYIKEKAQTCFDIENDGVVPLQIEWNFVPIEIVNPRPSSAEDINTNIVKKDLKATTSATSLFSADNRSPSIDEQFPFSIIPKKTIIYPKEKGEFEIQFSPKNLSKYRVKLQSNILCLKPKMQDIEIIVTGQSLMPIYYFEIEKSDYLANRPDEVTKCGAPELKDPEVIEFESVGTGVVSVRKFNIVNPTKEKFTYKFNSLEEYPPFSFFDCKTPTSYVAGGKKSEVTFTFKPYEFGNFEAYYVFRILEKKIRVPFLLAGKCRQPNVYFTQSCLTIKPTILMVPSSATCTLKNNEDTEFSFRFTNESLANEDQDQELVVSPKSGKINPKSEKQIKFTFKAEKIGSDNFYVKCIVEKIPTPVTLFISTYCTEVISSIVYPDKIDTNNILLDKNKENIVNFGTITPKKKENINFTISNDGQTGFFYVVVYDTKPIEHLFSFSIKPEKDFVPSGKKADFTMNLEALKKADLRDFKVKINICYGPTYLLLVNAKAEHPLVKFSFKTYDFGPCIVQTRKSNYYNVSLEVKNIGTRSLLLENFFQDTDHLTVNFKCCQIKPSSSHHISIYFHPMNVCSYNITIPMKVNSVKFTIKILGEAEDVNLQLVNKNDKYIDLGGILVGTGKQYVVPVINRGLAHVNAFFDLWQRLPIHSRPKEKLGSDIKLPEIPEPLQQAISKTVNIGKKSKDDNKKGNKKEKKGKEKSKSDTSDKDTSKGSEKSKKKKKDKNEDDKKDKGKGKKKKGKTEALQEDIVQVLEEPPKKKTALDFLKITPRDSIHFGPDKKGQFVLNFMPTVRTKNFSEEIFYEVQDYVKPLCIVRGYCIAPEFKLSEERIKFSNVVLGRNFKVNVLLRNVGDIRGRFQWVLPRGMEVFTISPQSGYVGPSSELEISLTYEPKKADSVIKTKAKCFIEGIEKILELTLEATSTKVPVPISTLYFTCPVREISDQCIKIVNPTKDRWIINPIVSNDHFSVPKEIIVEPDDEYLLDVTYTPETMTILTPHNATLFLPLPEGKVILHELIGQTLPPVPINKIRLDVKTKTNHTETLLIRNWLNKKQRFTVTSELTSQLTPACLYKISGNSLTELLPNQTKEYKWGIYVIHEISLDFKVIFTNVDTKEYMFYEICVDALPADPSESIEVFTCVRKPVDFKITLENPIDYPVTFTIACDLPDASFDENITVEPYSTEPLIVRYNPLKSDQITTQLHATCPELGTITYWLNVTTNPPLPENTIRFKAELGDKASKSILWKNTFQAPVDFYAKFDHPVFSWEKNAPIPEGESVRLRFYFEPSQLGVLQSKAIVSSAQTGNYIYPLVGECVLPTPKGPYLIKPGSFTTINFVNPFLEDQTFTYSIDSDAFYLKINSEPIKAKKSTKINVYMQSLRNLDVSNISSLITGRLFVEFEADDSADKIRWVFYIQNEV